MGRKRAKHTDTRIYGAREGKMSTRSGLGPGGPGSGLLPRGGWLRLTPPLRRSTGARLTSGWDITPPSLLHHERDVVDDLQPLGIVIRSDSRRSTFPMSAIPPGETHDDYEGAFGATREDVRPCGRTLRRVLPSTAPLRLNRLPPRGHLNTDARDFEVVASLGLVGVLDVLADL